MCSSHWNVDVNGVFNYVSKPLNIDVYGVFKDGFKSRQMFYYNDLGMIFMICKSWYDDAIMWMPIWNSLWINAYE